MLTPAPSPQHSIAPSIPDGDSWILPGWAHLSVEGAPLSRHKILKGQCQAPTLERAWGVGQKPAAGFFIQKIGYGMGLGKGGKHDGKGGEGCSLL